MTITEISTKYDVSRDTLRYYERIGMIPRVHRNPNGLRNYTEEDCHWVSLALCLRKAELPIEAIVQYVQLCLQGESTAAARRELLVAQRAILAEKRNTIDSALIHLDEKIARYDK